MKRASGCRTLLAFGLVSGFSLVTAAQAQPAPGTIAENDSILIDGTTLTVVPGKAKPGISAVIRTLGAREMGPGAIVFRSDDKLYIVDVPLLLPGSVTRDGQSIFVNADRKQTNRLRVEYVPPKNPEHAPVFELLKATHKLETTQRLFSPFRLTVDLTVRTLGCDGMVNAWYEREESRPTVNICYEYLHTILQYAPAETSAFGATRVDALLGQFLFLVAHEIGHALFDIFEIPVFGREEDAADQIAAYFLLQLGKERIHGLVAGAAHAYTGYMKDFAQNPKVAIPLQAFSSNHGSPEERFYNLLCMAYGAEPELFTDLVEKGYLPKTRAGSCRYEFRTLLQAVRREISPHVDHRMASEIWDSAWLPAETSRLLAK